MVLEAYRKRRKFPGTSEPKPAKGPVSGGRLFVVQRHEATRLHFDFRMEHRGVLKSWAVPKGLPAAPGEKRLAVLVEDHPYAYKDFEGRIPKGQYGAGLVGKWDEGTYSLDGEPSGRRGSESRFEAGLEKGHLDFSLQGKRLRGSFSLVRLKRNEGEGKNWLLIKRHDAPAGSPVAGLAEGRVAPHARGEAGIKDLDFGGAVKRLMPHDVSPMLATLIDEPFDREGWGFEVKWDGYRSLAEVLKGKVRLISRRGLTQNAAFPTVVEALKGLPSNLLLDGEIVAVDKEGRPDFQSLQSARSGAARIIYYVFDILYAAGHDLRPLPLRRRRAILEALIRPSPVVRLSDVIEKSGIALFRAVEKQGLEGIVAKDLASPYLSGQRTRNWLKIKTVERQEAVICGFTEPRASRKHFGALVLGAFKGGDLVYVGSVGSGFSPQSLKDIHEKLTPLVRDHTPFTKKAVVPLRATWVAPRLVCEVKFQEWTADGLMRQPVFLGLRTDKKPKDVHREQAAPASPAAAPGPAKPAIKTRAALTHLDKVFWPEQGYTKRDVMEYYWKMADWILPYLKDRPQSLNRHPDGIEGKAFFQKNMSQPPPAWVKTVKIRYEGAGKLVNHLVCQNRDTLIFLANAGCIEINVWNSSLPHLDAPDYIVIDFDPLDTSFLAVVEAVLATKDLLDDLGWPAFCKTSGGKGMHVYIPLAPRFSHDQARELAHLVSVVVAGRHPDSTSLERMPASRRGKVYLDYVQNRWGATMAAPYALRPREGAPVSTPLEWSEVTTRLDPLDFNIRTVPERMAAQADPWKGLFEKKLDISKALAQFEKWRRRRTSSK